MCEMIMRPKKACFPFSTLRAIEKFRQGKDELEKEFPDLSWDKVRNFLENDITDGIPAVALEKVQHLNSIRKDAIQYRMAYAQDKARLDGIQIPEKYMTGDALDVFFSPEVYRYYDFWVYSFFSWFQPWEEAQLMAGPLFSI